MAIRTAKSSSKVHGGKTPRAHRRPKIDISLLLSYYKDGMGDLAYYFGCCVIRAVKNTRRSFVKSLKRVKNGVARTARSAAAFIAEGVVGVWEDIVGPFKKARKSMKSLAEVMESTQNRDPKYRRRRIETFFRYGWKWNKHLVGRMMNYLLPALSLVLCVGVVHSMLNLNYVLEVSYQGQPIGYVTDEGVYDAAKKIIQNRMVSNHATSFANDAVLSIAVADDSAQIATEDVMAESLLSVSGTEIAQATGLYVGGTFYGATASTARLEEAINDIIEPYKAQAAQMDGDVVVKFTRDVELVSGVYPAESIVPYEQLESLITSNAAQDLYYTVQAEETAGDIALRNGITLERLRELNPGVDVSALAEGTNLLVAVAEPLLSVKTVKQITYTESIAFETEVVKDSRFDVGYMWIVTTGEQGEKTITAEIEYENGYEVSTTIISEEITRPAVNQEIIVGIRGAGGGSVSVGSGYLTWPTGGGYSISRGWSSYHFGIDIAAAYGTPIYAADNGVVIVSTQLVWDYGIYIILDHNNGMQTVYAHHSANLVNVGDVVNRGQTIALMGSTGNSTGSHLHFEVRLNGVKVDPAIYLYG